MPTLHKLAENHYISYGICGTLDKVENAIDRPSKRSHKKELMSIHDRYKHVTSTWAGYDKGNNKTDYSYPFYSKSEPISVEPKIGRNDPYPCGSGKKYKKCCL